MVGAIRTKIYGKFTFRDTSVIDYVIYSPGCLGKVKSFESTDLDTLFSDGHSLLSIVISLPKPIPKITHIRSNCPHKRWDESKNDIFIQNINRQEDHNLISSIQTIQNKNENISINDIDSILNRIAGCFKAVANSTFSTLQKVLFKEKIMTKYGLEMNATKPETSITRPCKERINFQPHRTKSF